MIGVGETDRSGDGEADTRASGPDHDIRSRIRALEEADPADAPALATALVEMLEARMSDSDSPQIDPDPEGEAQSPPTPADPA